MRILIIDDEPAVVQTLHREFAGHSVMGVPTHADALLVVDDFDPEVVVLDLSPSVLGDQCAEDCSFLDEFVVLSAAPIVVHTGRSDEESGPFAVHAIRSGAPVVSWLTKPASPADFVVALQLAHVRGAAHRGGMLSAPVRAECRAVVGELRRYLYGDADVAAP